MTRFVNITVQVRPHGEAIELDGQRFTSPAELWDHLHGRGAVLAKKPRSLLNSVFIPSPDTDAWARAIASGAKGPDAHLQVKHIMAKDRELAAGRCKQNAEDLGL